MCGARGEANTSFLGRTEREKPDFRLWHAILRTIAVFLAPRTVFMSVKPVRWPKKLVVVLSTHVGRQRAHPLVPNLNLKKAVFYNWPPLRRAFAVLTLGPTSMATCLLHCRPRDGEAPCTVAQRLLYRDVPAAASHGTAFWACQGSRCFGRRAAEDPLSSGWAG